MESTLISYAGKLSREQLEAIPTPMGTDTHRPVPHGEVVRCLLDALSLRRIGVSSDEYAVSRDSLRMFGVVELDAGFPGCRFALGIRNSHDKSLRLALTVGYRVFVCENLSFQGDYTPVLAKHSKHFSLINALSIGVDDMMRNFEPMIKSVELWRETQITDVEAKMVIYEAFIEGALEVPRHLAREVHTNYFEPTLEDFMPRTRWSLSNAFTTAFKELEPIPQFRATARLGEFLKR